MKPYPQADPSVAERVARELSEEELAAQASSLLHAEYSCVDRIEYETADPDRVNLYLKDGRALTFLGIAMPGFWLFAEKCPQCGDELDPASDGEVRCYVQCGFIKYGTGVRQYTHFEEKETAVAKVLDLLRSCLSDFLSETSDLFLAQVQADSIVDFYTSVGASSFARYLRENIPC